MNHTDQYGGGKHTGNRRKRNTKKEDPRQGNLFNGYMDSKILAMHEKAVEDSLPTWEACEISMRKKKTFTEVLVTMVDTKHTVRIRTFTVQSVDLRIVLLGVNEWMLEQFPSLFLRG